jgi:hypothetical protein
MSAVLADIIEELEHLPQNDREKAARYIHELAAQRRERRASMLRATAGSLSGDDGAGFEEAIAECSKVDEKNW